MRRSPMPMFFFRRNVHDISHPDYFLVGLGGDDAFASSDKQHLIAAMRVHFVPGTRREVDDAQIKVVAHLRREQRLACHGAAREQGSVDWLCGDLVGFEYLRHWCLLLSVLGLLLSPGAMIDSMISIASHGDCCTRSWTVFAIILPCLPHVFPTTS